VSFTLYENESLNLVGRNFKMPIFGMRLVIQFMNVSYYLGIASWSYVLIDCFKDWAFA